MEAVNNSGRKNIRADKRVLEGRQEFKSNLALNRKIKGIIFDFDGVISSFEERVLFPIMYAALMVKPDITEETLQKLSIEALGYLTKFQGKLEKKAMMRLNFEMGKKLGMSNFESLRFVVTTVIMYAKNRKKIVPLVGAREVLRKILASGNYKVALITNSSRKVITEAEKHIPEIRQFDLIFTRDDLEFIKPDAGGFFKALEILELEPEETITIGDQASDIVAGKGAGVRTIAFLGKFMKHTKKQLVEQNPDFIINDIRDLPELLLFLRDCIIEDIRTTVDLTEKSLQDFIEHCAPRKTVSN